MEKKTITIVIPTYNEEENIPRIYERIVGFFKENFWDIDMRCCL